MDKVYKLGFKFLTQLTIEQTYQLIATEAMKLVKADYGSLLLLNENQLQRVYASDPVFYKIQPRKRDFMYRVLKSQKPVILSVKQIAKSHPAIGQTKIKSDLILPLINLQKSTGILSVMSLKDKYFTEKEVDALKLFLPIAVMAIRKAELYEEAEESVKAKDLFISMAGHELRTPLTTINGYAQLLKSKLSKSETPEARWAQQLAWESNRMTQLVNELLEIDRIRTGKLKYMWKECFLKELISKALVDFRFTHPENRVIFKNKLSGQLDRIIGDDSKLLQVIINLLDNAAKFSPLDKEISISLDNKSGYVVLEITDCGRGIAKKDLQKIYEMFYRGGNHTREGMGLGLFLAKNIIVHHRGTLSVKSKENKGTTVEVRLPGPKN
ncbi:GAF domain-containing protein [Candidatus Daviesbacteria bacterium]|nr:GAF domain-containing protein [Candidatus Daviesbacteria bacterium]